MESHLSPYLKGDYVICRGSGVQRTLHCGTGWYGATPHELLKAHANRSFGGSVRAARNSGREFTRLGWLSSLGFRVRRGAASILARQTVGQLAGQEHRRISHCEMVRDFACRMRYRCDVRFCLRCSSAR